MNPAKLGYAEIHYGADIKKIVPKSIPGFWYDSSLDIPYINQMRQFLDGALNPKSIFYMRNGIVKTSALAHLESISNSSLLDYKDKLAVCSFLSSLWFKYLNLEPTEDDLKQSNRKK